MKEVHWTIDFSFVALSILAMFWVFHGDPDLWDKWHAHAMEQGCAAVGKPASQEDK